MSKKSEVLRVRHACATVVTLALLAVAFQCCCSSAQPLDTHWSASASTQTKPPLNDNAASSLPQTQKVGSSGTSNISPFSSVVVCVPFTVLISPSKKADKYTVTTAYDQQLADALTYKVQGKALYLEVGKGYESSDPIKLTISLPADQLESVSSTGLGNIVINAGFDTTTVMLSNMGTGNIAVRNMTTSRLTVSNIGTGNVHVSGQLKSVEVQAGGTGNVIVLGAGKMSGKVGGTADVFVGMASDSGMIELEAAGTNTIYYTQGTCLLGGMGGISQCAETEASYFPTFVPEWTCGMKVEAANSCSATAVAYSSGRKMMAPVVSVSASSSNSGGTASASIPCSIPRAKLVITADP